MDNKELSAEEIAKEIFYKPATNGQAENSIKEGAELIKNHVKIKVREELINLREAVRKEMFTNQRNWDIKVFKPDEESKWRRKMNAEFQTAIEIIDNRIME